MRPKSGIVTVSDRASQGVYDDASGPAIEAALRDYLATECDFDRRLCADERDCIAAVLRESSHTNGEAATESARIGRATAQAIFSAVFMPIRLGTSSPKMSVR